MPWLERPDGQRRGREVQVRATRRRLRGPDGRGNPVEGPLSWPMMELALPVSDLAERYRRRAQDHRRVVLAGRPATPLRRGGRRGALAEQLVRGDEMDALAGLRFLFQAVLEAAAGEEVQLGRRAVGHEERGEPVEL
jgi:hypothetical protein